MTDLIATLNEAIVGAAGAPWVLLALFGLCVLDGFFPPIPSETVVVGLAAVGVATGTPSLWVIIPIAAAGATVGDSLAYWIGRRVGTQRFAWMRTPRVQATIERATAQLHRRSAAYLLTARYIPVGRVAVNMTAGATRLPFRRFLPLIALAGLSWAAYNAAVGAIAGVWVQDNPLLGIVIAVALAMLVGLGLDRLAQRRERRRQEATQQAEPSPIAR